jgi:hypothetical protein
MLPVHFSCEPRFHHAALTFVLLICFSRFARYPCSSENMALAHPIFSQQTMSRHISSNLTPLGYNPLWVSREEAAHPNVRQPQPELYYTLQTETSSSMWWTSIFETVNVVLGSSAGRVNGWIMLAHLLSEEGGVVDTLCARADLLTSHEHVIRVRERGIDG